MVVSAKRTMPASLQPSGIRGQTRGTFGHTDKCESIYKYIETGYEYHATCYSVSCIRGYLYEWASGKHGNERELKCTILHNDYVNACCCLAK